MGGAGGAVGDGVLDAYAVQGHAFDGRSVAVEPDVQGPAPERQAENRRIRQSFRDTGAESEGLLLRLDAEDAL